MKKLFVSMAATLAFLSVASLSYADGSTGNVTVSKTVLNPQTNTYVKNLVISDGVYHPGDTIIFHITLANTGNQTVPQIIVRDTLPQYVEFITGVGSYDQKNKIVSFLAYNLKPNTTQSVAITTKVVSSDQFPSNQRNMCLTNKVSILLGQNQTTQDTAQFCISMNAQATRVIGQTVQATTKGGQPVYPPVTTTTTPSTGPEAFVLPALLTLAGAGSFIRKKTKLQI